MKYSYAAIGMLIVGIFAFAIVMVFQSVTINNEADYYSLKEAMEASMFESIDWAFYATGGLGEDGQPKIEDTVDCKGPVRIIEEKFVSNFTRRFLSNTMGNTNKYIIDFYDIMEYPPKATVIVRSTTSSMSLSTDDFTVVNNLTGILESSFEKYNQECKMHNFAE